MKNTIQLLLLTLISSLYLSAQTFVNNGADITIESGAEVFIQGDFENNNAGTIHNEGTIEVTGDWTNNTFSGVFMGIPGTLQLTGNTQNILGNATAFGNLDMSNSTGNVQLHTDATIFNSLTLGNQILDLNQNTITVFNDSPAAIFSSNGYIISEHIDSRVQWISGFSIGTYTIPFGTADGTVIPLTVDITSTDAGNFEAATFPTNDANSPLPTGVGNMNFGGGDASGETIDRFWDIDVNGGTAEVTFTYAPADLAGNTITEAELEALHWNGSEWLSAGSGSFDGGNSFTGTIALSGPFTLTSAQSVATAVVVQVKVFLEGPYDVANNEMTTILRANNLLPLEQPFARPPWGYMGTEGYTSLEDIPATATDWILIEVRDVGDNNVIVEQRAAMLLKDGTVQDVDGTTGVKFNTLTTENNYFISVKSRNHLATLGENAVSLPNAAAYDFTDVTQIFGGDGQSVEVEPGVYAQLGGDLNSDGVVTVIDFNFYTTQTSLLNVYADGDANMDKAVTVADFNVYQSNTSVIGVTQIRY